MKDLTGKKLLILGGKPIGSREVVSAAKSMGVYTIVTDYLPVESSPAKQIADEMWSVSTSDIDQLAELSKKAGVNGIYAGVHEFNIRQMIKLCKILDLPCYCTMDQWNALENKANFKKACKEHGISVTREYFIDENSLEGLDEIEYPIITKPADGSGSRGFSICYDRDQLLEAYQKAKSFSETGSVLVETFMDYRYSVIINYTIIDGEVIFSGISDKRSKKVFDNGAPIMSLQVYPSEFEAEYIANVDSKAKEMLKALGLKNGVIWIEAFCKNGKFTFNELGFRFGGSLTYYPVMYYAGIDQLSLQIEYALLGKNDSNYREQRGKEFKNYCVLPTHLKPGRVKRIDGMENLQNKPYFYMFVPVHFEGDQIQSWGSAQQVFAYIHFLADSRTDISSIQEDIMKTLHVYDDEDNEMLFNLFDSSVI